MSLKKQFLQHFCRFQTILNTFCKKKDYDIPVGEPYICDICHSSVISMKTLAQCVTMGSLTLQWRHNGCDGVPNHQPHHRLLNRLLRRRSKKTSKLRVTSLCDGNSPLTGEFPSQRASKVENVSIWWHHHEPIRSYFVFCHMILCFIEPVRLQLKNNSGLHYVSWPLLFCL